MPKKVLRKMRHHMLHARRREIGGMLMGEDIGGEQFRVVDFSVDTMSGTSTSFVRNADQHDEELAEFFRKTGADYRRFNYLGEWHTHPCFSVNPSKQDMHAMQNLVDDVGDVNFAVLLIARLRWYCQFDCSAHLFVKNRTPAGVGLTHELKPVVRQEKM